MEHSFTQNSMATLESEVSNYGIYLQELIVIAH